MILEYSAHPTHLPSSLSCTPRCREELEVRNKKLRGVVLRFVNGEVHHFVCMNTVFPVKCRKTERPRLSCVPAEGGWERGLAVRIVGGRESFFACLNHQEKVGFGSETLRF